MWPASAASTSRRTSTVRTYLVRLVGANRVVPGSDHPADMSYVAPVAFVDRVPELTARERDLVLGGNAQRLLKL